MPTVHYGEFPLYYSEFTFFYSGFEGRAKLRDWVVWLVRAGCYSQAALPMPLSKPLYLVFGLSPLLGMDVLNESPQMPLAISSCKKYAELEGIWNIAE